MARKKRGGFHNSVNDKAVRIQKKITIQKIAIVFNNCNLITKDTYMYNILFIRSNSLIHTIIVS